MRRVTLVTTAQVGARLEVKPGTVRSWRTRYDDFPQPAVATKVELVWNWEEVWRWAQRHGRLPGQVSANVSLRQAALRFGLPLATLAVWSHREGFPPPVTDHPRRWSAVAVEEFIATRRAGYQSASVNEHNEHDEHQDDMTVIPD